MLPPRVFLLLLLPPLLLRDHMQGDAATPRPGLANVTLQYATQYVDHFGYDAAAAGTYAQRYFTYEAFATDPRNPRVVFFYAGNEDNIELYVNNTGLMWELGRKMGAVLIFAEHRYFGTSDPAVALPAVGDCRRYLTAEQATADYATLIRNLRRSRWGDDSNRVPVIGFGGRYVLPPPPPPAAHPTRPHRDSFYSHPHLACTSSATAECSVPGCECATRTHSTA